MKTIILILAIVAFFYWLFILRPGRLDFWKIASKFPDEAYDFFKSQKCFKVFEGSLPDDYRSIVPKEDWTGPFRLWVPKLDGKKIFVFGKNSEIEQAQNEFLSRIEKNK